MATVSDNAHAASFETPAARAPQDEERGAGYERLNNRMIAFQTTLAISEKAEIGFAG